MHELVGVLDLYAGAGGLSAGFQAAGGYRLAVAVWMVVASLLLAASRNGNGVPSSSPA